AGVNILLHPINTKAKRAESHRVPEEFVPYIMDYLQRIRPVLLGRCEHDGFWVSYRGSPLIAGRLYDIARARVSAKFGKALSLHDFRRSASTFLAMEAPEKIGLIPVYSNMCLQRSTNGTTILPVRLRQGSALQLILPRSGSGFGRSRVRTRNNLMRAALYARYSTDLQSACSIEDQIRLCRERVEKESGTIVDIYSDYAISGSSLRNRPGMRTLLEEAKSGKFDCVIAEALDR